MMDKKYDLVLSDLGNVLINFDHRISVRKILLYTPMKEADIYNLFFDSNLTGLYEEGRISSGEFFEKVKKLLQLNIDYQAFLPLWNDIFFETELNIKYQDFLKSIKDRYKLVMISNLNESHFEFLKKKMPIFSEFDKLVLSYEVGFRKPAPEIYNAALKSVGVDVSRTFYIDDRKDLIESASELGIKGIVFNGEEAFQKITEELGHDFSQRLP